MNLFGWNIGRAPAAETKQFEDVLMRLVAAQDGGLGMVTPENCMRSPTVHAIVTAISRRISVSPIHVYRKSMTSSGREMKERLPSHPVAKLLQRPNSWQTRANYWLDAASCFVRYGRFFAYKSRGSTGPIRELIPLHPGAVEVKQNRDTYEVTYRVNSPGEQREYRAERIHHVRGAARDFLTGDSPVKDVELAIALEIACEQYGASFFDNGAVPLLIFKFMEKMKAPKQKDGEKSFIDSFQEKFAGKKRHRAMVLPQGMDLDKITIENDKAQMLESRKFQRTVIAGAFGVPPHLVGDLERATFNNVEQQDSDFTLNVVMPVIQAFEAAIERDLLTDDDRNSGVVVRFNLDSILRADFKTRQEGLQIQRSNGVISPNEWREIEGRNPIDDDRGGEEYLRPSNMVVAGQEPEEPTPDGQDQRPARDQGDRAA